jgi:hypothetical protein
VTLAQGRSRKGLAIVRFPSPARRPVKERKPFWTTCKYGLRLVGTVNMSFKSRQVVNTVVRSTWSGERPCAKALPARSSQGTFCASTDGVWLRKFSPSF